MSLNKVEILGAVGRDPELQTLDSGFQYVQFNIAANDTRWSNSEKQQIVTTVWVTCNLWGDKAGDFYSEVNKGDEVLIVGRLDQRANKLKNGTTDTKTRIVVYTYEVTRRSQRAEKAGF